MENNIFSNAKLLNNMVLIEVVGKYDTTVKLGNTSIEVSKEYEKEKFISTTGIVRAIPERLTFGKEPKDMQWETEMILKVNDRVTMSFMAIAAAIGPSGKSFTENGKLFCFVNYRDIVYTTRDGIDILLNGYCLVKPIKEDIIPGFKKAVGIEVATKFSNKFGEIIQCGEPNKRYVEDTAYDDPMIKKGDIVAYLPVAGIKVYRSSQDLMMNKNMLLKIQRRYMLAIMQLK